MATYQDSGVHIELGDDASRVLYEAAKATWKNRKGRLGEVIVPVDDFSGVRAIDVSNLPPGTLMNISFDGVGTKVKIAQAVEDHTTVAFDLIAMVADDAVVRGAEPVLVGSILDVNSLGKKDKDSRLEQVTQLAKGYIAAAKEANVAIINGEIAELGDCVGGIGPFRYNWGASVTWFARQDRLFTGREIKEGDHLVALREEGLRSNGISLVRKILTESYGEEWHLEHPDLAQQALHPSRIYSRAVVEMFGGFDGEPQAEIHGVVHITGGGIPGKLGRALKPSGLGATLDHLFSPCDLMLHCQEKGDVPDEEAYRTWNMGQGMLIMTPEPDKVMEVAKKYSIESKVVGRVETEKGIRIQSRGYYSSVKMLMYR
ncbi:hypothetical protein HYX14_06735 [Candidatus Woesearchaeota archaeon]|nr:hypothetical protein [Candidatus Woesearchaeota archaeon]